MRAFAHLLDRLQGLGLVAEAAAHCDIPCKIYDPGPILIDALTVVRMIDILDDWRAHRPEDDIAFLNTVARAVAQKEEHAEKVKQAVRVIWGDYFKAPQFEAFPQIHELTHRIMLQASAARQGVSREAAVKLVDLVNEFAEIFWATKSVKTKRCTAPYPPALAVVYPDL
ncbi:superoxide dismutase, Ni [Zavarzinia compransoris]|uniref:Superoxide dismutase, Ni n=1 Tax=Zavarzinia compransoris TaxID=1264899 RepID=A0A317ED10_9PROT|nr:superoxide dismutase, Ni [Zavarzinia compransoris]PWR24030.1 superoxide dismutase, Ni [Zavarzinia compransoris]TDP48290.1 nickel superoxide dismutase [Zavarzinia compransoris]